MAILKKVNITLRYFSGFKKVLTKPTEEEISNFKSKLFASSWKLNDDLISTYPAKQLYITLESILDKSEPKFMESLDYNKIALNETKNVNLLFKIGDKLPIGYTLAYCNPLSNESELSSDGYDNYHAPAIDGKEYFKRRMWVSGSFNYNKENPLKFGSVIKFTETVDRIKVLPRNGVIFADYRREFNNELGISVIEYRRLCYLNSDYENNEKINISSIIPDNSITVNPSIITSFRMSALTFNSHQIHYNPDYSRNIEKYPNPVIEAPLLISMALQFWTNSNLNVTILSFKYKIMSPCFINEPLTINYKIQDDNIIKLWIMNKLTVCFDSTIQI
ncbi:hypothetical protein C6P40_005041 [Pichia californica]|uniref:Uncharacterized protein n=1 Tax=Pichia californica TaxID=460514 RepID=A0A9P7BEK5_9ASCO|nr:hypothetical protein C6P42_005164 [[Candida] californica]KAG0689432.1 hypothetical protein C6P40_005041 [[Candida] californica]